MKMAHTCVRVKDLDASLEFYKTAFNFVENRRRDFPENKFTLVYLTLPGDDYELELTYNYDSDAYDLGNGYGHIAISTDDLEGLQTMRNLAKNMAFLLKSIDTAKIERPDYEPAIKTNFIKK